MNQVTNWQHQTPVMCKLFLNFLHPPLFSSSCDSFHFPLSLPVIIFCHLLPYTYSSPVPSLNPFPSSPSIIAPQPCSHPFLFLSSSPIFSSTTIIPFFPIYPYSFQIIPFPQCHPLPSFLPYGSPLPIMHPSFPMHSFYFPHLLPCIHAIVNTDTID